MPCWNCVEHVARAHQQPHCQQHRKHRRHCPVRAEHGEKAEDARKGRRAQQQHGTAQQQAVHILPDADEGYAHQPAEEPADQERGGADKAYRVICKVYLPARTAHDQHVPHHAVGVLRANEQAHERGAHDAEHRNEPVEHAVERYAMLKAELRIVQHLPVRGQHDEDVCGERDKAAYLEHPAAPKAVEAREEEVTHGAHLLPRWRCRSSQGSRPAP